MKFFPSRYVFLQIGLIEIRWYAVLILSGALLTYYLTTKEGKKAGYDDEAFDDLLIGTLSFGILGARVWYCMFYDFAGYFSNPLSILEIWDGGLAIQGGIFGGLLFIFTYCKFKRYSFFHLVDMIMPNVLIAQAIGRWGNYMNQEAFGNIVDESYFDGILSFLKEGMYIGGYYRQPMFFYESILCLAGFILIKLYRKYSKTYRGDGIFCYLAWYGAVRFWIESQRTDSLMFGDLKMAQVISIVFLVLGMAGLLGAFRKWLVKDKPVIIFDLDGTLIDTRKAIGDSFEHVFKTYKPELVVTDEDRAAFMGPTLKETFEKYVPERKDEVDDMIKMYKEFNWQAQKESVVAFPHVKEMLDYLKENNYQFAIASSKNSETVKYGLEIAGLADYFETIIGVEQVINPKPAKDVIVAAYNELGGGLDHAVYIGDSSTDVKAAQNAGVYAIAYCSNPLKKEELEAAKPNALIDDFAQLETILQQKHSWTYNLK